MLSACRLQRKRETARSEARPQVQTQSAWREAWDGSASVSGCWFRSTPLLEDAPFGYEIFLNEQDDCLKVVLTP